MGRINEDVNTYTNLGRCGELFMTIGAVQLGQKQTQKNSGGMTELYLDSEPTLKVLLRHVCAVVRKNLTYGCQS